MKPRIVGFALCFVCPVAWASAAWHVPSQSGAAPPTVAEQYLFAAANAERTQRGLRPLRWDDSLYLAADRHAHEMVARASISHQYAGEPELSARGRDAGARFSLIAENVAESPTPVQIQSAWMRSPPHRANLLDSRVDFVGIRVLRRDGELYAVEDFDRAVTALSLSAQEAAVGSMLASRSPIIVLPSTEDARRTCSMQTGYVGPREPWFILRYTTGDLRRLPAVLQQKLVSGKYGQAVVAACAASNTQNFSVYRIAVMLYP